MPPAIRRRRRTSPPSSRRPPIASGLSYVERAPPDAWAQPLPAPVIPWDDAAASEAPPSGRTDAAAGPASAGAAGSHLEARPQMRPGAQSSSRPHPHVPLEKRQRCPASDPLQVSRPGEHSTQRFDSVLRGSSSQGRPSPHSASRRHWMHEGGLRERSHRASGATHSASVLQGGAAHTPGAPSCVVHASPCGHVSSPALDVQGSP